jgi:hypothetical protein
MPTVVLVRGIILCFMAGRLRIYAGKISSGGNRIGSAAALAKN